MNWKWRNHNQDHFVTFDHHEQRIAALEADLKTLSEGLLSYLDASYFVGHGPPKRLAETLRMIIKSREPGNSD